MQEIIIYKTPDGQAELEINLAEETVWLSLNQMAQLFQKDKSVISRHLTNIFKIKELDKIQTVAKFATVQKEGKKEVAREIDYYNLDAVVSVGYRVNSKQGVRFRQWASKILKEHIIKGYTLREKRLAECGINELQLSVDLLQKTLIKNDLVNDIGAETIQLILSYTKTWDLLLAYDEDKLKLPKGRKLLYPSLEYAMAQKAIETLKSDLSAKNQASSLFGREREHGLSAILGNIEQTFDGKALYKTVEERAAHLFYFTIKDHPFSDGNKRIGCLLFLIFLKSQHILLKLNENGMVALALLIAESNPKQKDLMIRLIVNLLIN